ncbi:hypothetical protein [Saccharopolyspora taberi]|uniref:Uncharacterized protein n=1 Tax=Saccharopolyspora taberi TaxID=60895 RepID=A0ABN3V5H7_9PSEU
MLEHQSCVIIRCDGCGEDEICGSKLEDSFAPHFETEAEAIRFLDEYAEDWQRLDDGTVLCDRCVNAATCREQGCDMGEWIACLCQGYTRLDLDNGTLTARCPDRHRWCNRCGRGEYTHHTHLNRPAAGTEAGL